MKNPVLASYVLPFVLSLLLGLAMAACSSKEEEVHETGDWTNSTPPLPFKLVLIDKDGKSLFDPETEEGWEWISGMSIEIDDTIYKPRAIGEERRCTRYEFWCAIHHNNYMRYDERLKEDVVNVLEFGNFDVMGGVKDLTFTVVWPNGERDEVVYNLTWHPNPDPQLWYMRIAEEEITVNGEAVNPEEFFSPINQLTSAPSSVCWREERTRGGGLRGARGGARTRRGCVGKRGAGCRA